MRAGHRSYSDAVSWLTSTAPSRTRSSRLALRLVDGTLLAGILVLGAIGLLSPARFGSPGASPFKSGWPWLLLLGLVGICAAVLVIRRRGVSTVLRDLRRRTDATQEALEQAVAALGDAPAMQSRFAVTWVFVPGLLFVIGATFSFATAYFAVDAVLARFQVGWQQPLLGVADAAIAFLLFRASSRRLALWPLAYRIWRELNS